MFRTALDVDAVERHADTLAACPNFWIPRERLEAGDVATAVEHEVCGLLHGVLRQLLPPTWSGAEYWVQARGALAQPPPASFLASVWQVFDACNAAPRLTRRARAWRSTLTRTSSATATSGAWRTRCCQQWSTSPATPKLPA